MESSSRVGHCSGFESSLASLIVADIATATTAKIVLLGTRGNPIPVAELFLGINRRVKLLHPRQQRRTAQLMIHSVRVKVTIRNVLSLLILIC